MSVDEIALKRFSTFLADRNALVQRCEQLENYIRTDVIKVMRRQAEQLQSSLNREVNLALEIEALRGQLKDRKCSVTVEKSSREFFHFNKLPPSALRCMMSFISSISLRFLDCAMSNNTDRNLLFESYDGMNLTMLQLRPPQSDAPLTLSFIGLKWIKDRKFNLKSIPIRWRDCPYHRGRFNLPAFASAILCGHLELGKYLYEACDEVDINALYSISQNRGGGNNKCSLLHLLASRSGMKTFIPIENNPLTYIISINGDINVRDGFGNTALHLAAKANNKETAQSLIDLGIDLSIKNDNALTARDELIERLNAEETKYLAKKDESWTLYQTQYSEFELKKAEGAPFTEVYPPFKMPRRNSAFNDAKRMINIIDKIEPVDKRRRSKKVQSPVKVRTGRSATTSTTVNNSNNASNTNTNTNSTIDLTEPGVAVHCDDCGKWRMIQAHINTSLLKFGDTDRWTCEMNVGDPFHQSCDAPEEEFSDNNTNTDTDSYSLSLRERETTQSTRAVVDAVFSDALNQVYPRQPET